MGFKKLIKRLEAKIADNKLLADGQYNDNDIKACKETDALVRGYVQALEIVVQESLTTTAQSKMVKRASKYLSGDDILGMIQLIIDNRNETITQVYIDWIDGVQVCEKFENTFSPQEFLEQIKA